MRDGEAVQCAFPADKPAKIQRARYRAAGPSRAQSYALGSLWSCRGIGRKLFTLTAASQLAFGQRFRINDFLRQLVQQFVGFAFFVQRLLEKIDSLLLA